MRRGRPGFRRRTAAGLLAVAPGLWACTEEPLTAVDADDAPGPGIETREARIEVAELPVWRDTTLTGFANPGQAGFFLAATEEGLRARTLLRFSAVADSVSLFGDTLFTPVDSFANASLFVRMDTTSRSTFPPLPFTLRLHALERGFEASSATWTRASEGQPWTTPGGDLGPELASFVVEEVSDTLSFRFDVPEDSLLEAWRRSDGGPGVALSVAEGGARIRFTTVALVYDAFGEDIETPFPFSQSPSPGVFIYEPEQPDADLQLRIGGLPAWRYYLVFQLPELLDGTALRNVAVSHAELVFHPLEAPPGPFRPGSSLTAQGIQLLGDPFELGAKTPIGGAGQVVVTLDPDSLAAGRPIRLDVTTLVVDRLTAGQPSVLLRLGLRGTPDAQDLGFWDFASVEHPERARRPELLVVYSPPPSFGVP